MKKTLCFAMASVVAFALHGGVVLDQTIQLKGGWNAVAVQVEPSGSLEEVFADWPVESVGVYDASSFIRTAQFSDAGETGGAIIPPLKMWYRKYPAASDLDSIPAGSVIVVCNTNLSETATVRLRGRPAAPRTMWHVAAGTDSLLNYVGVSLADGASVYPDEWLAGFPGIAAAGGTFYRLGGKSGIKLVPAGGKVSNGDVLVVGSDFVGNWPGTIEVSPRNGLDFGANETLNTLYVKNTGARARTVSFDIVPGSGGDARIREWLHWRDAAVARTNAVWNAVGPAGSPIAAKLLDTNETWTVQFGLDRSAPELAGMVKGTEFGAVLRVLDVDGGSSMRADVAIEGEASGGVAANKAWPAGLWVADVAFDKVQGPGGAKAGATGGTLKLRLPVHIDANGRARLLQRAVAAGAVAPDGTYGYRLYAGTANIPRTANTALRVSAVCLPTETPVIEATAADIPSGTMTFDFTVAGGGATSLLRHPLHPQHDNLRWDFKTPAPDGDDVNNYKFDVKPETFSVSNRIEIALGTDEGSARWNPLESMTGTCRWTFTGLRHEGAITLSGPLAAKRVSPLAEIVE